MTSKRSASANQARLGRRVIEVLVLVDEDRLHPAVLLGRVVDDTGANYNRVSLAHLGVLGDGSPFMFAGASGWFFVQLSHSDIHSASEGTLSILSPVGMLLGSISCYTDQACTTQH